jgi:hypothetical protein
MSARDDYPLLAPLIPIDLHLDRQAKIALDEIDNLRRWKAEALEVLRRWDAVAERFDLSGHLGEFEADAVGEEIDRMRACQR